MKLLRHVTVEALYGRKRARVALSGKTSVALDLDAHRVTRRGEEVALRQKEFEILTLMMTNLGTVITRERLFDEVWGTDWLGDTRTLDVHMSWLRAKLEDDPTHPIYLQTVRGVGYRFARPEPK